MYVAGDKFLLKHYHSIVHYQLYLPPPASHENVSYKLGIGKDTCILVLPYPFLFLHPMQAISTTTTDINGSMTPTLAVAPIIMTVIS